jgi:SAM-dependent methyltransferase
MYNLPENYNHRLEPAYFNDVLPDSVAWQADVYRLASRLALNTHVQRLVDIGCGRGGKLLQYADTFRLTGIDYGSNIQVLNETKPQHKWISVNLNEDIVPADMFTDSVVICADVIEHLPDPMPLIQTLRNACQTAKYVLLSTPDRQRVYKGEHLGPSGNPYHCREWTNAELVSWLRSEDLPVQWYGWTISNDHRRDQVWTSLVVMSKTELILGLPPIYERSPVEWDAQEWKHA